MRNIIKNYSKTVFSTSNYGIITIIIIMLIGFLPGCFGRIPLRVVDPVNFAIEDYQTFSKRNIEIVIPSDWEFSSTGEGSEEQDDELDQLEDLVGQDLGFLESFIETEEEETVEEEEDTETTDEESDEEEAEEPSLRSTVVTFNNKDGTILGKVFEYWDGNIEEPFFELFLSYINHLKLFTPQDFQWMLSGDKQNPENSSSYMAKCWYRREFQVYYAVYRAAEQKKIYLIKTIILDPDLDVDSEMIGIFLQSKIGNEQNQRSVMKFGVRIVAPENWLLQETQEYEVFSLYYPDNPALISMRYIKRLEPGQDASEEVTSLIRTFKEENSENELDYETEVVEITPQQISAILFTISGLYTQNEVEVALKKYFIVNNRIIFELITSYGVEALDDDLESEIEQVFSSISFN